MGRSARGGVWCVCDVAGYRLMQHIVHRQESVGVSVGCMDVVVMRFV